MLIETCEYIKPSVKSVLQEKGILYVSQLVELLKTAARQGSRAVAPAVPGAASSVHTVKEKNHSDPTDSTTTDTPQQEQHRLLTDALVHLFPVTLHRREAEDMVRLVVLPSIIASGAAAGHRTRAGGKRGRAASGSPTREDSDDSVGEKKARTDERTAEIPTTIPATETKRSFTSATSSSTSNSWIDSLRALFPGMQTAAEVQATAAAAQKRRGSTPTHVTTCCRALDELLGGGAPVAQLTEITGPPGAGKTQLLQQLAVSCALPAPLGGLDGECVYVDTEGSFSAGRLEDMALSVVTRIHTLAESETRRGDAALGELARGCTVAGVMRRVRYVRVTDVEGLLALLYSLPQYVEGEGRRTRMVVIDSIASVFRLWEATNAASATVAGGAPAAGADGGDDGSTHSMWQRAHLLRTCGELMQQYAHQLGLTFVVSNQVTTRSLYVPASAVESGGGESNTFHGGADNDGCDFDNDDDLPYKKKHPDGQIESSSRNASRALSRRRLTVLLPALGDSWAACVSNRMMLCYHRYEIDSASTGADNSTTDRAARGGQDLEDVAVCRPLPDILRRGSVGDADGDGNAADDANVLSNSPVGPYYGVTQHRVARLLRCAYKNCGSCRFAISRKGIRDVVEMD